MKHCECSDPGCPACNGCCQETASYTLYRVDMEDRSGVEFCETCGADALESGVFGSPDPDAKAAADEQADADRLDGIEAERELRDMDSDAVSPSVRA